MHDIINFLKGAVKRGTGAAMHGAMSCYCFGGGLVTARNEAMQAGIELDSDTAFIVPADEFDAVLGRLKSVSSMAFNGQTLTLKGGRLKASIQCVDELTLAVPEMPETMLKAPATLVDALKLAIPFTNDIGWNSGIRLKTGKVTAISNTSGIDIVVAGLEMDAPVNLPGSAAEFLVAQGNPDSYAVVGGAMLFKWDDGRWLQAQLLAAEFPATIDGLFDKAEQPEALMEISAEWREAFIDIAALAGETVEITAGHIRGTKGAAECEAEVATNVDESHRSRWSTKVMDRVLACATHWAPSMYPAPVFFVGTDLRGVVVGFK